MITKSSVAIRTAGSFLHSIIVIQKRIHPNMAKINLLQILFIISIDYSIFVINAYHSDMIEGGFLLELWYEPKPMVRMLHYRDSKELSQYAKKILDIKSPFRIQKFNLFWEKAKSGMKPEEVCHNFFLLRNLDRAETLYRINYDSGTILRNIELEDNYKKLFLEMVKNSVNDTTMNSLRQAEILESRVHNITTEGLVNPNIIKIMETILVANLKYLEVQDFKGMLNSVEWSMPGQFDRTVRLELEYECSESSCGEPNYEKQGVRVLFTPQLVRCSQVLREAFSKTLHHSCFDPKNTSFVTEVSQRIWKEANPHKLTDWLRDNFIADLRYCERVEAEYAFAVINVDNFIKTEQCNEPISNSYSIQLDFMERSHRCYNELKRYYRGN